MARIQGVPKNQAGPIVKVVYRLMRRGSEKMTGRAPARGSGIEPLEIWAHQPKMMSAMGKFQGGIRKRKTVDERVKNLCELKGAVPLVAELPHQVRRGRTTAARHPGSRSSPTREGR